MGIIRTAGAVALVLTVATAAEAGRLTDQPLVEPAWLAENLGNESLVVVDIRAPARGVDAYGEGHIPGAVNAPYGAFGWRTEQDGVPDQLPPIEDIAARIGSLGIGNDDHVVIAPFGKSSTDFGGATWVYWTFKVLGHDAVSILDGGMEAWNKANGEVSTATVTPEAATFSASFRPELIADADEVAAARDNGVALVDARPADQHLGKSKSSVARVAGTIPGAVNIEQSSFYDQDNLSFVGRDRIAELAEEGGIDPDGEKITFCNTGHWGSVAWFGLSEILGNKKTKLYDGSIAEWTADESRPVQ